MREFVCTSNGAPLVSKTVIRGQPGSGVCVAGRQLPLLALVAYERTHILRNNTDRTPPPHTSRRSTTADKGTQLRQRGEEEEGRDISVRVTKMTRGYRPLCVVIFFVQSAKSGKRQAG